MKKRIIGFTAAAMIGILMLTACTSSDTAGGQNSGTGNTTADNTGNITGSDTGDQNQGSGGTQEVTGTTVSSGTGDSTSGTSTSGGSTAGEAQQGAVSDEGPSGEVIPDEDAAAAEIEGAGEAASEDAWSGTYIGDDETVTVTKLDDATISFSFAQSGISGSASVNGYQAVYNGDDHYVVVFNVNGTVLDVSVSNEEDYDASGSPLIGTYVKEG